MLAEKPLPTSTTKIVSTNDGLKTSPANVVQNNSRQDRPKNSSYRSWPKQLSCLHPKNCIGFKNADKYPIHIQLIGLDLKSKKLDLDMKPNHLNGFKVD